MTKLSTHGKSKNRLIRLLARFRRAARFEAPKRTRKAAPIARRPRRRKPKLTHRPLRQRRPK